MRRFLSDLTLIPRIWRKLVNDMRADPNRAQACAPQGVPVAPDALDAAWRELLSRRWPTPVTEAEVGG